MNSQETTYEAQSLSIHNQQSDCIRERLQIRSFLWTALLGLILLLAQPSALFAQSAATGDAYLISPSVGADSREAKSDPGGLFWEDWLDLSPFRQAFTAPLFIPFPTYQPRVNGCNRWGCGTNHNETLVCDTTGSSKLKATKGVVGLKRVCGLNHNETIVRDTVPTQQTDDLSLWLSIEQAFAAALPFIPFPIYQPRINACGRWGCGQNHNETLVREAAPMWCPLLMQAGLNEGS